MDILNDISAELKEIDETSLSTQVITVVVLKLEEYIAAVKEQNKPAPIIQVAENFGKLFDEYLLGTQTPTSEAIVFIKETIELKKKWHADLGTDKENEALTAAPEANRKLELLIAGKELSDTLATEDESGDGQRADSEPEEDLPMEYELPVSSEEDAISYEEFINESTEHIDNIETKILELEDSPDDKDLINEIFRPFHSMKGAAGFLGLVDINKLSHEAETLLDLARKDKIIVTKPVVDILLESLDVTKRLFDVITLKISQKLGRLPEGEEIHGVAIGETVRKLQRAASQSSPEEEKVAGQKAPAGEFNKGSKLGEILVKKGEITQDQFDEALKTQSKRLGEILVEKGVTTRDKVEQALSTQKKIGKKVAPPIKVDTEKLDNLMELVGELVIAQTLVSQDKTLQQSSNQQVVKNIVNLEKITKVLQEQVMAVRMIPVKQTFMKMNRLVRDVANKTNKKVELKLLGEDTEIDKTVVDELNDPLIHLLRNSVDHGIEKPEDRIKAGKPEIGTVQLNAYHQGGSVVIEIIDNGKGLSRDLLYEKGLEKNLISKDKEYTDQEIFNLILLPGFSTVKVASDISGRGVGMDVVASFIKNLGGKLEIHSKLGEGSTFSIKLPLTMSIVDGMVVRVGKERYIIPTIAIIESIRPAMDSIVTVQGEGELINVRGKLHPLIRLHKLFNVKPKKSDPWDALIVLIESNGKIKGVMVDDLLGQQQVVIKSLGKIFKAVKEISGSAIMGDGVVGLILDAEGVVNSN